MRNSRYSLRLVVFNLIPALLSASQVLFSSSPNNINSILSSTLDVSCLVQTGTAATDDAHSELVIPDLSHVLSITISKFNNETNQSQRVASVTTFDSATLEDKQDPRLTVQGSTTNSATRKEHGHLKIGIANPMDTDAGNYTCLVYAITADKYVKILSVSQIITAHEITFQDFIDYAAKNNKEIESLKAAVSTLRTRIDGSLACIQSGQGSCQGNRVETFVPFSQAFNSTPTVVASVSQLTEYSFISSSIFPTNVLVTMVNNTGFNAKCMYGDRIYSVQYTWLASLDECSRKS